MSEVVTLRLPEETARAMRQIARRERRSLNEVGTRIVEEWLRQNRFAHIEFRSFNGERHACIKERLQVWQVILVARGYGMDVAATAEHLRLRPEQVQAALLYFEAYPDEINAPLEDNALSFERLGELLPALQRLPAERPDEA